VAVSDAGEHAISANLARVRERIARACVRASRSPDGVRLLAVSKGHAASAIRVAHAAGQRDFGESYVQELANKVAALSDLPGLRFRFVGRLQRNKAKDVVRLGASADTVDSLPLAQALSQRALALGQVTEVLIQVNVDREPQKAGVLPEALGELVGAVRTLPALELRGLLVIPRPGETPESSRPAFATLRELGAHHSLPELSMGMSDDLEVAIEEGATIVRVGTAIFGERG
jgi:pyridoxal phosphate enzyme (YggS family)